MRTLNGLLVAAMLLLPATAFSGTIYSNTILSGPVTGLTGPDRTIQIDDVLVPSSRDPSHLPLAIDSITLDLSAVPGQSGRFSIYLFPVKPDGTPAPNPVLLDTALVTFTGPFQLVIFGSDSGTLFTVSPDFTAQPGFGLFYMVSRPAPGQAGVYTNLSGQLTAVADTRTSTPGGIGNFTDFLAIGNQLSGEG